MTFNRAIAMPRKDRGIHRGNDNPDAGLVKTERDAVILIVRPRRMGEARHGSIAILGLTCPGDVDPGKR
jgi:hypothetical protein